MFCACVQARCQRSKITGGVQRKTISLIFSSFIKKKKNLTNGPHSYWTFPPTSLSTREEGRGSWLLICVKPHITIFESEKCVVARYLSRMKEGSNTPLITLLIIMWRMIHPPSLVHLGQWHILRPNTGWTKVGLRFVST